MKLKEYLKIEDFDAFLTEAEGEGLLRPGEAEAMKITFIALARIGGKTAAVVIKLIVKLLKKAGVAGHKELKKYM